MPDDLTGPASPAGQAPAGQQGPGAAAPAPAVSAAPALAAEGRPPRRPSWLRAALISLIVLATGAALGAGGYKMERSSFASPSVQRTGDGWRITARQLRELSGLGLTGNRLVWQDGASIEYLDLGRGKVLLLGPGSGMQTTWDPAVSDRFVVWFEAERQASLAAQLVSYDPASGRRRVLGSIGSVRSYPALSGDLAVWCSAVELGRPRIMSARVGGTGEWLNPIADGDGAPVVSDGLVVWAAGWTGPFYAKDVTSGAQWPVTASLTSGRLTGLALSGRSLVWGQSGKDGGSGAVSAVDVDDGHQQAIASGITGLAGPSYDGATVLWAEQAGAGSRIMARRPAGGDAFAVATTDGKVTEVAVSGDSVAWIEKAGGAWSIVVRSLPR